MYFTLNTDKYSGEPFAIGEIMREFSNELYSKTGLSLDIYAGPTKEEIDNYFKENRLQSISEEVIIKKYSPQETIKKYLEYIFCNDERVINLTIIDPFLFPYKFDAEYIGILSEIINQSKCESLTVITNENNYNKGAFEEVQKNIKCSINFLFSSEYHDRFWLVNDNRGFISGTSLNGFGKKISNLIPLEKEDVDIILNEINRIT